MADETETAIAPVRRSVRVRVGPERAFDVFAGGIGRWWPRSHVTAPRPLVDARIEPQAGGGWFGILDDGSIDRWGRVIVYDPPRRLVLAWQITADWVYDPDFVTEVEVTFAPAEGGGTEVTLEHRNLDRFGARAAEVVGMIDSDGGWAAILSAYAATAV